MSRSEQKASDRAPTVGAGVARGFLEFASGRGLHRRQLLELSGLSDEDLADHDNRIPFVSYLALVRAAARLAKDPAFALRFGECVDVSELSIVGLLTNSSETMLESLQQINRYGRLAFDTRRSTGDLFQLKRRDGRLWLVDTRPRPEGLHEMTEIAFAQLVCGTRRIGVSGWLQEVQVTHAAPSYAEEYRRVFQAPIVFKADWNALEVDEAYLEHRVAAVPRYAFGILTNHADALLHRLEHPKSTREEVEAALLPLLHTGEVRIEAIAAKLGSNRQALYRRLRKEGLTYEAIVDDLRRRLSLDYLSAGRVSISEIAYLVGFSDPAGFSRAFKRWTGKNPREFKRQLDVQ